MCPFACFCSLRLLLQDASCQRADWKNHRILCISNQHPDHLSRALAKYARINKKLVSILSSEALFTLIISINLQMGVMAVHCMDLIDHPENSDTSFVEVQLVYAAKRFKSIHFVRHPMDDFNSDVFGGRQGPAMVEKMKKEVVGKPDVLLVVYHGVELVELDGENVLVNPIKQVAQYQGMVEAETTWSLRHKADPHYAAAGIIRLQVLTREVDITIKGI